MTIPDLYTLLEVEPEAPAHEIRRSYFRLAKQLHPDRRAGQDPEADERFLAVTQAYEILIDPIRRDQYERSRQHSTAGAGTAQAVADEPGRRKPAPLHKGPTPEEERDARLAFQKAENLAEAGQYERALRAMLVVVRTVPDKPEYLSLLGYVMARSGQKLHAARDHCRKAVEAEPFNPDFHARLGYVYVQAGLGNTAQKCFEEALRLDPTHALALQHLKPTADSSGGGLVGAFKRLLGR